MVTVTATDVHNMQYITSTDISAINLEYILDQAIRQVNVETGGAVAVLSGPAGTKSSTCTDNQKTVIILECLIMAINSLLFKTETTWTIERRDNAKTLVGEDGKLTLDYRNAILAMTSAVPISSTISAERMAVLA